MPLPCKRHASKTACKREVHQIAFVAVTELNAHGESPVVAVSDAPADTEAPFVRTETVVGDYLRVSFRPVIAPRLAAIPEDVDVQAASLFLCPDGLAQFG